MSKHLTITEKNQWISIIGGKIQNNIENLEREHALEIDSIKEASRKNAIRLLGLEAGLKEQDKLKKKAQESMDALLKAVQELHGKIVGKNKDRDPYRYGYRSKPEEVDVEEHISGYLSEMNEAIDAKTVVLFDEAMKVHPTLKRIKELQDAKSEVHNAVWLATSPDALSGLWEKFAKKLDLELSTLEKLATSE